MTPKPTTYPATSPAIRGLWRVIVIMAGNLAAVLGCVNACVKLAEIEHRLEAS